MTNWVVFSCLWLGFVCALVAGVFLSFSDFVMAGIGRANPVGGIEAMQHINRTVFRSTFLTSFLSLVPLTAAIAVYAALQLDGYGRGFVVAAAVTYATAVFLVTITGNVPMNKRLDRMDHTSTEAAAYWKVYCRVWTRWNHVRTIGSAATAALFLLAAAVLSATV